MPLRPARSRSDIFGGSSSHLAMTDPISAAKYQINYFLLPNFIIHVIGLAALWALWYYLRFTNVFPYHHRVFYCRDVDLFKPNFAPEDFEVFVSYALLYVLGFTIPPIIMLVGEVMFWSAFLHKAQKSRLRHLSGMQNCADHPSAVPIYFCFYVRCVSNTNICGHHKATHRLSKALLPLLVQRITRCLHGSSRTFAFPLPALGVQLQKRRRATLRLADVPVASRRFLQLFCVFCCYIYYMINLRGAPLLRPMLIFGLVGLSLVDSFSRINGYKNHWRDIWVGWLIGFAIAVFLCYCVLCFQEIYHIVYRASEMPAALEPAETVQPPFFSWFRLPRVRAPSVKEEYVVYEEDVPVDDATIHQQPVDGGRHRKRDRTYEVTTTTESFHRTIVPPGGGTAQRQNAGSARTVGGMGSSHNGGGAYAAAY